MHVALGLFSLSIWHGIHVYLETNLVNGAPPLVTYLAICDRLWHSYGAAPRCDTVALYHCVYGKSLFVVVLLDPAPFAFCFASLLDGETHIWLGDLRFAFCLVVFVFASVFDLPCYMITGVNVNFISNCFFTCKDRALERDRPYLKEKNVLTFFRPMPDGSRQVVY